MWCWADGVVVSECVCLRDGVQVMMSRDRVDARAAGKQGDGLAGWRKD